MTEFKLTVDALILSPGSKGPEVLLVRRKYPPFQDDWAIPGGFVEPGEDLEPAAKRELEEETGLVLAALQQYHTFGRPDRDPRGRAVSVAYFGLIPAGQRKVDADSDASEASWFPLTHLPRLAFDHNEILTVGLAAILNLLEQDAVGLSKFNLSKNEKEALRLQLAGG